MQVHFQPYIFIKKKIDTLLKSYCKEGQQKSSTYMMTLRKVKYKIRITPVKYNLN